MEPWPDIQARIQPISHQLLSRYQVTLALLREDELHPHISGNKWRKLKFNALHVDHRKYEGILTFGGAFSNHIAATARAGYEHDFRTVGIIRGEDDPNNPTLQDARKWAMELHFVDRETYRLRNDKVFQAQLVQQYGPLWLVPEGGANFHGVSGCQEILYPETEVFDYLAVACGTGTTLAGLALSAASHQQIVGYPALKGGSFLREEVERLLFWHTMNEEVVSEYTESVSFVTDYHMGGYARHTEALIAFMREFYETTGIPLDVVYTGKMLFGLFDQIRLGKIEPGTRILAIHTGGLQGNRGLAYRHGIELYPNPH